jgi:hypothetical protein
VSLTLTLRRWSWPEIALHSVMKTSETFITGLQLWQVLGDFTLSRLALDSIYTSHG